MSQVSELLKEASKLDLADRAELVSSLLEELDPHPHYVTDEDASKRLADLKSGKMSNSKVLWTTSPAETNWVKSIL